MRKLIQNRTIRALTLILVVALIIAVGIVSIPFGRFQRNDRLVLLTFAFNGALWLVLLIAEVNKRAFSFKLIHWSFCLLFFFFAAVVQYTNNYFPWIGYRENSVLLRTNLLLTLWTIGVCLGSQAKRRKSGKLKAFALREWNGHKAVLAVLTLLNIGNTIYRISYAGLMNLLARATSDVPYGSSSSMALLVGHCFQALPGIAAAVAVIHCRANKRTGWVLIVNVVCLLLSYFPTSTARYTAAALYLGLLLVYSKRLKTGRGFILLFLSAFMVVLPFLNAFRNDSFSEVAIGAALQRTIRSIPETWLEGDYDAYTMLTLIVDFVRRNGPTWGRQLMGVLLFWVPRTIWPNKPIGSGAFVSGSLGFNFTNLSAPLPAEGIINFGVVGVFLFALVFGWLMTSLDNAYWETFDKDGKRVRRYDIIYPFICIMFFFVSRGDLLSSFAYMVAYIVVWIGVVLLSRFEGKFCWRKK